MFLPSATITAATTTWQTVKRLLDEGAIGPLRQINATMCADSRVFWQKMHLPPAFQSVMAKDLVAPGDWRSRPERMGGGTFSDSGSHLQDLVLWLADGSPTQITALAQRNGNIELSIVDVLARLDNGSSLVITFNATVSGGEEVTFYGQGHVTCYGERGAITVDWTGLGMAAKEIWMDQDGKRSKVEPEGESLLPVVSFVAAILDGAPNPCPAHEAARAVVLTTPFDIECEISIAYGISRSPSCWTTQPAGNAVASCRPSHPAAIIAIVVSRPPFPGR